MSIYLCIWIFFCKFAAKFNIIMGKPFKKELKELQQTLNWIDRQDISQLHDFLCGSPYKPLISIGSGGSYSACHYSTLLYREYCGIATQLTPLAIQSATPNELYETKMLYISASGNNKDILQSLKIGAEAERTVVASLCTTTHNKISKLSKNRWSHLLCHYDFPCKDGFLATNSLYAFMGLMYRSYNPTYQISQSISLSETPYYFIQGEKNLSEFDYFVVLYGRYGEPIAYDLESKFSEAGLGAVLLSDYRNFGHGRHNWIDKQGKKTCVITIITPSDKLLALKTIDCLPDTIPVLNIETSLSDTEATLDLLWRLFYLVSSVGEARNIDPGKPGVPDYGTDLYNLNYAKLVKKIKKYTEIAKVQAILRKTKISSYEAIPAEIWNLYSSKYDEFINRLKTTKFGAIVFDYDGTLSSNDVSARYSNLLEPAIKNALTRLLDGGIRVAIVTGRGKSVGDIFNNELAEYKHQIYIGYYNGGFICPMQDTKGLADFRENPLNTQLRTFEDELLRKSNWIHKEMIEERNCQLTIKDNSHPELLAMFCREIIMSKGLSNIQVWQSSHSTDVVVKTIADKRNIIEWLGGTNVLCIGDRGDIYGNDYQLLSTQYSLSVDETSADPDTCWNFAPEGTRGVEATLYYVKLMEISNQQFRLKIKE